MLHEEAGKGFANLNTANGFHSYIKERYEQLRGVAIKYLNRYNALFVGAYRNSENLLDKTRSIGRKSNGTLSVCRTTNRFPG